MLTLLTLSAAVPNEHDIRRQLLVDRINSQQTLWRATAYPRFRGKSHGEVRKLLGVKPESRDLVRKHATKYVKKGLAIPTSFDSATNWPRCAKVINDIRDQSNCGCCWAFGAAEAASDRLCINTNATIQLPLSAQQMCFCASSDGCSGGDLMTPWNYIQQNGLVTGGQYNGTGPFGGGLCSSFSLVHCHHHGPQRNDPYPPEGSAGCPSQSSPSCPSSCDSSAQAPHNNFASDAYGFSGSVTNYPDEQSMQESILTNGPLEAAFSVYEDFANYAGGIYKYDGGSQLEGGHAIRIVGWGVENGVKYWKIANSWNPYWGESGFFRIVRGTDECGIEDQATASSADAVWKKL